MANKDNEIRPLLRQYNLNQHVPNIFSVYDSVAADVQQSLQIIQFSLFTMMILGFIVVMIIWQNVYNYFELKRNLLGVQTFLGFKKQHKYKRYFFSIASGWALILGLFIWITGFEVVQILPLFIPVVILETVISIIFILRIDKNRIPRVLKGG